MKQYEYVIFYRHESGSGRFCMSTPDPIESFEDIEKAEQVGRDMNQFNLCMTGFQLLRVYDDTQESNVHFKRVELCNGLKGMVLGKTTLEQSNGVFMMGILEDGKSFYFDAADVHQGILKIHDEYVSHEERMRYLDLMATKMIEGESVIYVQHFIDFKCTSTKPFTNQEPESTSIVTLVVDWNNAPDWATCHTVAKDGQAVWWEFTPQMTGERWYVETGRFLVRKYTKVLSVDWKNSLTRRPS